MAPKEENARGEDLFLELGLDNNATRTALSRVKRSAGSKQHYHTKHHSVPHAELSSERLQYPRPRSSGQPSAQTHLKLETTNDYTRESGDQIESAVDVDDNHSGAGQSPTRRLQRYSTHLEHSPRSPSRLFEQFRGHIPSRLDQRRLSVGLAPRTTLPPPNSRHDSIEEPSERKQSLADSASVDSETAPSTVWDELDDLKSRIKRLELTGRMPTTSGAATTEQSERPRTATTAPTTINSSPKQTKSSESTMPAATGTTSAVPKTTADTHPLLRSALEKSRTLISPQLYRVLEATASDALQAAALTGAGSPNRPTPTGTPVSTGLSASERQTRRKIDSLCRNLTDLCLALCESKQEAAESLSPPLGYESPLMAIRSSPPTKLSRSSFGEQDSIYSAMPRRTMSRLEARRSSMLGSPAAPLTSVDRMPSADNLSEVGSIVSRGPRRAPSVHHVLRANSLLRGTRRTQVEEDEDPTLRPPSRAMTDFASLRLRAIAAREDGDSPSSATSASPWRDALATRRAPSSERQRARRFIDTGISTVTEDNLTNESPSAPARRFASIGGGEHAIHHPSRRSSFAPRAPSINQRTLRNVMD